MMPTDFDLLRKQVEDIHGALDDAIWNTCVDQIEKLGMNPSVDVAFTICTLNQQLAAKDQQLAAKDQQLAAKDQQLSAKDQKIAAKDKKIVEASQCVDCCMKNTYTRTDDNGRTLHNVPRLTLNNEVHPSTGSVDRKKRGIPKAAICSDIHQDSWCQPKSISIPTKNEKGILLTCVLGPYFANNQNNYGVPGYENEIDVQLLVKLMVDDAIKCLGLNHEIKAHLEIGMYAMVPDIVVVRFRGCIIFVIEVKSPERRDHPGEVFKSERVHGQIFLYLQAMYQHGVRFPMGAVCTYNKIRLVSLHDLGEIENHRHIVEEARAALQSDSRSDPSDPTADDKNLPTPSKTKEKFSDVNARLEESFKWKDSLEQEDNQGDQSLKALVFCSPIYELDEVFVALVQALKISFLSTSSNPDLTNVLPFCEHGDDLGGRLLYKMSKEGGKFVVTSKKKDFKVDAKRFPEKSSKIFYMLSELGRGRQGRTYLSCTTSGRLAAVKLFVPKRSSQATEAERNAEERKDLISLGEACSKEKARWEELLPKYPVLQLTLDHVPALVMPHGKELTTPEEKFHALPEVEKELIRYANQNWKYRGSDLRWRHVLRDHQNKLLLVDLGSLEKIADDCSAIDKKHIVKEAFEMLKSRIDIDGPSMHMEKKGRSVFEAEEEPVSKKSRKSK